MYLTAQEAADSLGITKATLYAYKSRGQLRSEPIPGQPKEHRYTREDVERLRERKEARRDPAKAAARGLNWGSPVLDSCITCIHDGKLYYRGRDAIELAKTATLEETACVLWNVEQLPAQANPLHINFLTHLRACSKDTFTLMQAALPIAAAADLASYDLRPAAVPNTGARILRLLTSLAAGRNPPVPTHLALQSAWAPGDKAAADAIRAALVLCADHELNVSAFTARCAASAAAPPYDVVSAALATLKGSKHGGMTERVASLFVETGLPRRARAAIASRLRRGERIAGFGHRLYPQGDPRAALLLNLAEHSGNLAEWRLARSLTKAGFDLLQEHPTVDFALVAMARAYKLPEHAPLILFALGRSIGWIAHAIEQYAAGDLIRPRARYTGPPIKP